jgi:acetyl-CoA C-acetyltransferase
MEDLFISPEGGAVKDVLDGFYDSDGEVPCQIDGGLKCFGHPIGASGIRMIYEMYLQLQGRAGARQRPDVRLGLIHNLGGFPARNVCSVAIVGQEAHRPYVRAVHRHRRGRQDQAVLQGHR